CVESGYIKERLVASNARRLSAIESGEQIVVGVNRFTETAECPLLADGGAGAVLRIDPSIEREHKEKLAAWRASRDPERVRKAIADLIEAAKNGSNIMPPSIAAAHAGVTTGEWADAMRKVFGEYRAPTGIAAVASVAKTNGEDRAAKLRLAIENLEAAIGRRPK